MRKPNRGTWGAALVLPALALAAGLASPARAEVYKYQDADGRWHFTDRPPPDGAQGGGARGAQAPAAGPEDVSQGRDLAARLQEKYKPGTPVQAASLATVKIEAVVGTGSGFFVSDDGLLLTNRHVVRPPEDWAKQKEEDLAKLKAVLDRLESSLSVPREQVANKGDYDRAAATLRELSQKYRAAKRELDMLHNQATVRNNFRIEVKDGTKLTAELVGLSQKQDLALLQVKGYRTPFITPMSGREIQQTDRVYLIGSPLGVADTITQGICTGTHEGLIGTDSKIFPGNSGGPMVTEDGFVIGVNTIKLHSAGDDPITSSGLGLAIPIAVALQEFPRIRR